MATKNHALLLFSKAPIAGTIKTRLTVKGGGPFTDEEAAEIYRRSLFDVAELCCIALHDLEVQNTLDLANNPLANSNTYTLFISTTPFENVEVIKKTFEDIGEWPRSFNYISDAGDSLDDHLDDAFKKIFDMGFDSILSLGADTPLLSRNYILNGFEQLQRFALSSEAGGIVYAPCREDGVSLIGWTKNTTIDHQGTNLGAYGRPSLDAYIEKAQAKGIPMSLMPPVTGIDDVNDFAHVVSMARGARYCKQFQPDIYVPERFLAWVDWRGIRIGTP